VEEATAGRPPKKERRRCRDSGDEEDQVSGKNTRGDQLGNMVVAQDEDGENIGAASMEDHTERKGTEVKREQAIVDMDNDTIKDKIFFYMHMDMPEWWGPDDSVPFLPPYEPHQLTEVYEQLAFYRIRGYKVSSILSSHEQNQQDVLQVSDYVR
jgi:hypothetical protein